MKREMKIAYLVLAHNNPQVLKRAVERLSCDGCSFFIHIDKKSDIQRFSAIRRESVFLTEKRIPVHWGEFSQVEAILALLRQAVKAPLEYDYFVLLSGTDYPLRSAKYIQKFLEEHRGVEFTSMVKVPAPGKPLSRINTLRFPSNKPIRRFAVRVLAKLGMAQRDYRKYLGSIDLYSGSTWWALTRDACLYILKFVEHNPQFVRYFENVFAADEAFFHTILGNSSFKSRLRRNLLYDDWSAQAPHPAMINGRHLALFEGQEKVCMNDVYGIGEVLFARKFSDESLDLLQRVDVMIERKEACSRR
jgi:Core-2/I-Branching enzyme